ncbi:MAG: hypothetical protein AAF458_00110 [Pseudomonadota bacterium]
MRDEQLHHLVETIYANVEHPDAWTHISEAVSVATDSPQGFFFLRNAADLAVLDSHISGAAHR